MAKENIIDKAVNNVKGKKENNFRTKEEVRYQHSGGKNFKKIDVYRNGKYLHSSTAYKSVGEAKHHAGEDGKITANYSK